MSRLFAAPRCNFAGYAHFYFYYMFIDATSVKWVASSANNYYQSKLMKRNSERDAIVQPRKWQQSASYANSRSIRCLQLVAVTKKWCWHWNEPSRNGTGWMERIPAWCGLKDCAVSRGLFADRRVTKWRESHMTQLMDGLLSLRLCMVKGFGCWSGCTLSDWSVGDGIS